MKELERDDPFALVGVGYPVTRGKDTDQETARTIIEEYALTGFSAAEIAALFESPAYAMPYAIYRRRGAGFVTELLREVFGGGE